MRISLSVVFLALLYALGTLPPVTGQERSSAADNQEKKEVVVTVESVSAEDKTIKVQEMHDRIFVSDSTVFDDDVQLAKLHAGSKIKVVGETTANGKFQASEIRAAK